MREVEECPVCGARPGHTTRKRVDLEATTGILREPYIRYNLKLGGAEVLEESVAVCGGCSAVYRAPFYTDEEVNAIYSGEYLHNEDGCRDTIIYYEQRLVDAYAAEMSDLVQRIERDRRTAIGRIFDNGGRGGLRLTKLAERGCACTVYVPIRKEPCSLEIALKYLWSHDLPEGDQADLIVLCNVLEHAADPGGLIRDCHDHLHDRDAALLEIPGALEASWEWSMFYRAVLRRLDVEATHLAFSTERSVRHLLEGSQFTIRTIGYGKVPVCGVRVMNIIAEKASTDRVVPREGPGCRRPGRFFVG